VSRISSTRNHAEMSDAEKPREPWSDPDPQPGDYDVELNEGQPGSIEGHDGDPHANLLMISAADSEPAD
jgi:hypothetical protein